MGLLVNFIMELAHILGSTLSLYIIISVLGFLIGFLILGYGFRIIKSSLKGTAELPKFNSWAGMFKDGIKVYIVHFVYLIPIILSLLIFSGSIKGITSPGGLQIFATYSEEVIRAIISGKINASVEWILISIAILYLIIIIPIQYIAIANMANNNKLSAAFRFSKILNKISNIGLKNIIAFYIIIIIPFVILNHEISGPYRLIVAVVIALITGPYFIMYLSRLVALFYMSE